MRRAWKPIRADRMDGAGGELQFQLEREGLRQELTWHTQKTH